MSDDQKPMTDEERRAFLDELQRENLASMNPFERYLYGNGLFDDVIRPEITPEYVILEPQDLCINLGCEECIGYWKGRFDGRVTYCNHECHLNPRVTEVPYTHCAYLGCVNCPEVVNQGKNVSHCTCPHHRVVL